MYKVTILAVDKLRDAHWRAAADEYLRRLPPFAKVDTVEVASEAMTGTVTPAMAMAAEGERLMKRLPPAGTVIALDRLGKACSSEEFARIIADAGDGGGTVAFVIGGAAGLAPEVLAKANKKISFSEMTFPHEMARVVLLEQLYRAMTILAGKKYHY